MDFFQAQDSARRTTTYLLVLFALAVTFITVAMYLVTIFVLHFVPASPETTNTELYSQEFWLQTTIFQYTAIGVLGIVLLSALMRYLSLRGGGESVAMAMNGGLVTQETRDPKEQQLLNIVSEMSIASGIPIPAVYVIPDNAINAFAAGTSIHNAVIGVTNGALAAFTRSEMQGVIAHEFSHILNGDMRLNLKLIAVLSGIELLGTLGQILLISNRFNSRSYRSSRGNAGIWIVLLGIAVMIIGSIGRFFAHWIRAAVSRQREYLADASAVQFTRNPEGIGNALIRLSSNSHMNDTPNTGEYAHMYIGEATTAGLASLFSSHPPIEDRIRRILPNWEGSLPEMTTQATAQAGSSPQHNLAGAAHNPEIASNLVTPAATATNNLTDIMSSIGHTPSNAIALSQALLQQLPASLLEASHNPYTARALIYAMLLDNYSDNIRQKQLDYLHNNADDGVYPLVQKLAVTLSNKSITSDEMFALTLKSSLSLKQLSDEQTILFLRNTQGIIAADGKLDLFEWSLFALVKKGLHDRKATPNSLKSAHLNSWNAQKSASYILSLMTRDNSDPSQAQQKFAAAAKQVTFTTVTWTPKPFNDNHIYNALVFLNKLPYKSKYSLIIALYTSALHGDNNINTYEKTLLRTFCALLECPVPTS